MRPQAADSRSSVVFMRIYPGLFPAEPGSSWLKPLKSGLGNFDEGRH